MDEQTIRKQYIEKPDEEIQLLCSYTTRREGFLDILLSGVLLSSKEAKKLLGKIKTHRGHSMSSQGIQRASDLNEDICFSTGFVSFKYSNPKIKNREEYSGGLGILVPLEIILKFPRLGFSHYDTIELSKLRNLNKTNITQAVHEARKKSILYDDGYGNFFEIALCPELDPKTQKESAFTRVITYPRLELHNSITIAIPATERNTIIRHALQRQEQYKRFLDTLGKQNQEGIKYKTIDGRNLFYFHELTQFIETLTKPFDPDKLNILWYEEKNLEVALQHLSIL